MPDALHRRTVAEIQRKVIKQSGRNPVSRLLHAKNDKEAIAAWRLDLNRILHVFNVRPIAFSPLLLTVHFQTELAINTHVTVSDIRHDVANTHNIVSDVHQNVASTHNIVSDIHRAVVKHKQENGGSSRLVSDCCVLSVTE